MTTQVRTKTRAEHMAHAAAAEAAADKWAMVAKQHEAFAASCKTRSAQRNKSEMTAVEARDHEARCRASAKHARGMAADVR